MLTAKKGPTRLDRNNTNFSLQLFEHFKNTTWDNKYSFLKYYQNIIRSFINDVDTTARGLLVTVQMGLGKSILAISVAMDQLPTGRQPIILLTKSLQANMRGSIHKYVNLRKVDDPNFALGSLTPVELDKWIEKNFSFVSMNASNMLAQMNKATDKGSAVEFDTMMEHKFGEILKMGSLDGKLLIVDEAHNFFRAITNGSKNSQGLYDMIMKAKNLKILFLTGTPIGNDAFELAPCFNMLAGQEPIFPESYKEFRKLYVDEVTGRIKNKTKFQNRIMGLVSYVSHTSEPGKAFGVKPPATKAEFPEELPAEVVRVNMSPEQYVVYQLARDKEKEEGQSSSGPGGKPRFNEAAPLTKPKSKAASTYRVKSRQLSNYCPPPAYRGKNVDINTIPADKFESPKYTEAVKIIDSRPGQLGLMYSQFVGLGGLGSFAKYLEANGWQQYKLPSSRIGGADDGPGLPPVDQLLRDISDEASSADDTTWWGGDETYAIEDEMKITFRYGESVSDDNIILDVLSNEIPIGHFVIDYSSGPGKIVSEHLNDNENSDIIRQMVVDIIGAVGRPAFKKSVRGGAIDASEASPSQRRGPRTFAVISGEVSAEDRTLLQDIFNREDNKNGGIIDLLLISSTGAEGLDLHNGRYVIILEPYWNWGRIMQIIFRFVRNDSHATLPADQKNVQPYILLAVPPATEKLSDGTYPATTDTELYEESVTNQITIDSFNEALREVSIECMVNAETYCRKCNPTNTPLFTADPARDVRAADPCTAITEVKITAEEILVDGEQYAFVKDPDHIYEYRVFKFDPAIDGFRPLPEANPAYAKIVAAILSQSM